MSNENKKICGFIMVILLILNVLTLDFKVKAELGVKSIDIITINDLHGALMEDVKGKNVGMAKLGAYIKAYKMQKPDTIFVSGGDNYTGSAISNLTNGAPVNEIYKYLGLDASAVGNHEFDWGDNHFETWSREGGFDFLACNIYDKSTNKPVSWAKPYKVIQKNGVKVGLIGLTTLETLIKTKAENVAKLDFKDPAQAGTEWATKLKEGSLPEGKVDVVVAVTHMGSKMDANKNITGEIVELCNKVKNVDAVVSAHSHELVYGKVNNIPVVQATYSGRCVGKLAMSFDANNKLVTIVPTVDEVYKTKDKITEDAEIKSILDKYTKKLGPILSEVIGKTDVNLDHDRYAIAGTSMLGQFITSAMNKITGSKIAFMNGGGLRYPIPVGDITMGKLYDVMPFDNNLVTLELKGSDVKKVIENGIDNKDVGWLQVSGVKAYYDINKPFKSRIVDVYFDDGTKVMNDTYYKVSTIDFMVGGGDGYDFSGAKNVVDSGEPVRDSIAKYIKALGKPINIKDSQSLINGNPPRDLVEKATVSNNTALYVIFGIVIVLIIVYMAVKKSKKNIK